MFKQNVVTVMTVSIEGIASNLCYVVTQFLLYKGMRYFYVLQLLQF